MSEFKSIVQRDKVPQPTHRNFTLKKWQKGFDSISNKTTEDEALFEAGKWIFGRLERTRKEVFNITFPLPKGKLLKVHIGYINRTYNVIKNHMNEAKAQKGDLVLGEQLVQKKISGNIIGKDESPDLMLTACVDGAKFPLISAMQSDYPLPTKGKIDGDSILDNELKIMVLGQYYPYIEEAWREILWNNYKIINNEELIQLRPSGNTYDKSRAISDYRKRSLLNQSIGHAVNLWKYKLPLDRKLELSKRPVVTIGKNGKKRTVKLTYNETPLEAPPYPLVARIIFHEEYLEDLLETDLPQLPNVNLSMLLNAWETLGAFVEVLSKNFPENDGVYALGTLYKYAPSISKKELRSLFERSLSIDTTTANSIIDFFTFKPTKNKDLWSSPLIELEDKLLPLFSPILFGNLVRNIELWMKIGGVDLSKRGHLFERQARDEIIEAINKSKILTRSKCHNNSIKLGKKVAKEEVDIIFNIGNKVLIGEAKCTLYPTDPIEFFHTFQTLEYAAVQAKRKSVKAKECISQVKDLLGTLEDCDDKSIEILPFILTNSTLGVGYSIDGVPILDLLTLTRYIEDGKWEKFVLFGPDGSKNVGETVHFYLTEKEASDNIENYLVNIPQVDFFKNFIKIDHSPHLKFDDVDKKTISTNLIVELPIDELAKKFNKE